MPETLVELIARIKADATQLEKGLTDAEKQTEASSKKMSESLKKVGVAMAASGAAITATLGMMGKAAIDEEINVKHLEVALKGVGVSYDNIKDSLEAVITATQRKTGIADSEQRDTLSQLILVTKDYEKALALLPLTLDMAAYSQMNTRSAATYLAKAYEELEAGADKIGIRMGTTTVYFKDLNEVQKMVGGTAEAMKNPFSVLSATVGDLSEAIGSFLIPVIKGAIDKIVDIVDKAQSWAKENPELTKTLTLVALGLGAVLTVVGGLILILPTVISGIAAFGVVFHAALGPIGLISAAITVLIAAGTALYLNWDKVSHFFADIWSNMKNAALHAVDAILEYLQNLIGFLPFLGDKIDQAREKIANLIEVEKIKRDAADAEKALNDVSEALEETTEIVEQNTDATIEQTKAAKENIAVLKEQKTELEELTDRLKRVRSEYEYTRSDAGRLRITLQDVTFALFDMGKSTDDIAAKMSSLGDDAENVNKVMEAFGLTAQQVKEILDAQKESVDALGEAYVKTTKSSIKPSSFIKSSVSGSGLERKTYSSAVERLADEQNMSLNAAQSTIERYSSNPQSEEFSLVKNIMEDIVGYKNGGLVSNTGLAYLHAGETVIPANESMGNVVVNFTQPVFFDREDTMNKFVDMIRKGIQRQDRLRFGGAYSGA